VSLAVRAPGTGPDLDAVEELVLHLGDDLRALADVIAAERVSWRFSLLRPRGY